MTLANYKFLPWLREGLGNTIAEIDTLAQGGNNVGRAGLKLQVDINAAPAGTKEFLIVGPSDVIGFSKDLVIRTEPLNWSTSFAPNLLAHIEFYEEDFPWRYSPARADADKLRPWISLIVLKENEFKRKETIIPLPQIEVTDLSKLPAHDETWLWAHVQKIESSTLPENNVPDHIISRLICPRKLEANTKYFAFVIPTFESGRMAGLGYSEDAINLVKAQSPAWNISPITTPTQEPVFPVYYEWFFRTTDELDFEYLASLLEAKETDPMVGKKPMDCRKPGFGLAEYSNEFTLYIEGALKAPRSLGTINISTESTSNLGDFKDKIKQLLDLGSQGTADPVVTPPFYGQKHIFETTLDKNEETWIHQLNRNPAYRAVAGLGAKVFRKYQDMYLQKAWEQLESIVEANKIIDSANATLAISQLLFEKNIFNLSTEEMIAFSSPVHSKVKVKDTTGKESTLSEAFRKSCFNGSAYSTGFRRLTNKRGVFRRKLESNGSAFDNEKMKRLIIEKSKSPSPLDIPVDNPLVTDRPVFKYIPRNKLGDFFIAQSADGAMPLMEFANLLAGSSSAVKCEENIMHNLLKTIEPSFSITDLLSKTLSMPVGSWFSDPLKIKAALAYPDFDDPMYEKLKELSTEWLAPNLHLIPNNSVTILETNRRFIESFMVGVNVAMNQEMRWREYPTDERASCFRQFWDVKGIKNMTGTIDPAVETEKFKDISPIHTWKNWTGDNAEAKLDEFGAHNKRSQLPEDEQLVLVIRGDLLKCFPNTTIYASKAYEETYLENGVQLKRLSIQTTKPEIKFPAFKAEAGADLKFIGFDLTVASAKGNDTTDHGWFFVLQETPGETRFGLDINPPVRVTTWDDASWDLVTGGKITKNISAAIAGFQNSLDSTEKNTDGSLKVTWGKSSADMAYVLYQKPIMIAIHAKEMLS